MTDSTIILTVITYSLFQMLDRLLHHLPEWFTRDSVAWVFLSWYDQKKKLMSSQGVVTADQALDKTIASIWVDSFAEEEKKIRAIAMDVVTDTVEIHDLSTLTQYDPQEFGFVMLDIEDEETGVILPKTDWITDAKHALRAMKQKYGLHGKVEVIAFRTLRVIVAQ